MALFYVRSLSRKEKLIFLRSAINWLIAVFQQLLKANPADAEALYWGGQSAISLELDSTRKPSVARAWYDKAMQTAAASPLVQVGAGTSRPL